MNFCSLFFATCCVKSNPVSIWCSSFRSAIPVQWGNQCCVDRKLCSSLQREPIRNDFLASTIQSVELTKTPALQTCAAATSRANPFLLKSPAPERSAIGQVCQVGGHIGTWQVLTDWKHGPSSRSIPTTTNSVRPIGAPSTRILCWARGSSSQFGRSADSFTAGGHHSAPVLHVSVARCEDYGHEGVTQFPSLLLWDFWSLTICGKGGEAVVLSTCFDTCLAIVLATNRRTMSPTIPFTLESGFRDVVICPNLMVSMITSRMFPFARDEEMNPIHSPKWEKMVRGHPDGLALDL